MRIAWSKKVSDEFLDKLVRLCQRIKVFPDYLMACIAFESDETFSPWIRNAAGSGAVGLIQFMPQTAAMLGTSTNELARMSSVEQLDYVEQYFAPFKGRLKTLPDVYMAILWPNAVGKKENYILFRKDDPEYPRRYVQNAGLDWNKDGMISKLEAAERVIEKLEKGTDNKYVREFHFIQDKDIPEHRAVEIEI